MKRTQWQCKLRLTTIFLPLVLMSVSSVAQKDYVTELRKENRLPNWANNVCYEDNKTIHSGWFMLVAYQPAANDYFFPNGKDAKTFGYSRGLTYQEYLGSETGVSPMNMPISPEEYAEELPNALKTGKVSSAVLEQIQAEMTAERNTIAVVKKSRQGAKQQPSLEKEFLKDEEVRALLDAPDGTNYINFIRANPGYSASQLQLTKYYNAGIFDPPPQGGFKKYREGKVMFEKGFGSDVFESGSAEGGVSVRIQMQDTDSGLRFLKSHAIKGSGVGIPISGKCDVILKQDFSNQSDTIKMNVQIRTLEGSWMKITGDGNVLMEGVLLAGTSREFHALKEIVVKLGNAGVVELSYNGKPLPHFSPDSKTKTLTFTPDGPLPY